MKDKLDYSTQIKLAWNRAKKARDAAAMVYYSQCFNLVACVSWDEFKSSWAGEYWKKKNYLAIQEQEKSLRLGSI